MANLCHHGALSETLNAMARYSGGFSPCNITGFFKIHDRRSDPLEVGSTGAGVALDHGVVTRVRIRKASRSKVSVTFNRLQLKNPMVSKRVAETFLSLDGRAWDVRVAHECPLPIGCGYGTSGAGALGLSFAMTDAMGLSLTSIEAAKIAHKCEVECMTGLGTVASAYFGGFAIRTRPGAPGIGVVRTITTPASIRVVSASFGPLSTRTVLANSVLKTTINSCSRSLVSKLLSETTSTMFMKLSRKFADCLSLMSKRLIQATDMLEENGITCSMMMLGESLFCLIPYDHVPQVNRVIRRAGLVPVVSKVAESGARMI